MLKIGVNEPVLFEKAEINDKGTLAVTFKEDTGVVKPKLSLLEAANESSDTSGNTDLTSTNFLLFIPSTEYQNEEIAPEKKIQNLMKLKNQLSHILLQYTTQKNIKWNVIAGLPVIKTDEQFLTAIEDKDTYTKVYKNITEQFVAMAKSLKIAESGKKLRLFLVRTSPEKHYGKFRENFLESRPFLESLEIPKDKSKMYVKAGTKGATTYFEPDADGYVPNFDSYEIEKGKDNPIVSSSKADAQTNTAEEAAQVESVFGVKSEEPINFGAPVTEDTTYTEVTEDTKEIGDGGMNFGAAEE